MKIHFGSKDMPQNVPLWAFGRMDDRAEDFGYVNGVYDGWYIMSEDKVDALGEHVVMRVDSGLLDIVGNTLEINPVDKLAIARGCESSRLAIIRTVNAGTRGDWNTREISAAIDAHIVRWNRRAWLRRLLGFPS